MKTPTKCQVHRWTRRTAKLVKALERTVRGGHPWVYRDALSKQDVPAGEPLTLLDRRGKFLARGLSDSGPIGLRIWTTRNEPVADDLLRRRLAEAVALRKRVVSPDTSAFRLVHGEGDRMPGVVIDRYGPFLVVKLDGTGAKSVLDQLTVAATELGYGNVLLRQGRGEGKRLEHLTGGEPVPEQLVVTEHGMRLPTNLRAGQKTGLFLDHRESRLRVRNLAAGLRVLNLYGYTGGFSVSAGLGGAAAVTTVDVAAPALELARVGFELNQLPEELHKTYPTDVFEFLSSATARTYDLIISDPPSFAPSAKAVRKALTSYRKLHFLCLERLALPGLLLTASCSSHIARTAFEGTVAEAARDAKRSLQCLARWGAGMDHPTLPAFPEGDYLTVSLWQVR